MKEVIAPLSKKHPADFISLLGGKQLIAKPIWSEFDIINLSNDGITKSSLDTLISYLGMSRKAFAENVLDLSVKTLERKKKHR